MRGFAKLRLAMGKEDEGIRGPERRGTRFRQLIRVRVNGLTTVPGDSDVKLYHPFRSATNWISPRRATNLLCPFARLSSVTSSLPGSSLSIFSHNSSASSRQSYACSQGMTQASSWMSHCALLRLETRWSDEDEATTPVIGALKDVLERISVPLSMVTRDLMTQLLMACTRIVLPESYRDGAFPLRPLKWSSEEKAIMMTIDIPLAYVTRAGSDDPIQLPYGYDFEVAIPSDTPDECADLKADPFFRFHFSEDADKHATDAQKALAKFIYAHCARYALGQYEAVVLAQALLNQHAKKYSSLTFSKDVIGLPPPGILHEYRTYMPDMFGVGGQSQDIRHAISRYTSLVVDEYLGRQPKEECKHGLIREWKTKAREQRAILQQRMSKMRTKLSNSVMAGMRSALLKLARGKSGSLEQLMETRLDKLEREVKVRVDILEREVKNRLELLESMPSEKVKQELKDFIKKL